MHLGQAARRGPTRLHLRWLRSTGLAAALVLAVGGPALAQGYPPAEETLAVSTSVALPGEPVTVSGSGYAPGTTVTITFESTPQVVGVVTADASGRFTAEVVVPPDATPGMHTIRATGLGADGTTRMIAAAIRVIDPAAGAADGATGAGGGAPGAAHGAPGGARGAPGGAHGAASPGRPFSATPPGHAAAVGASSSGAAHEPASPTPASSRRSGPLGLTGPVAIPLLAATGLGCVALGALLTRMRRRRHVV